MYRCSRSPGSAATRSRICNFERLGDVKRTRSKWRPDLRFRCTLVVLRTNHVQPCEDGGWNSMRPPPQVEQGRLSQLNAAHCEGSLWIPAVVREDRGVRYLGGFANGALG